MNRLLRIVLLCGLLLPLTMGADDSGCSGEPPLLEDDGFDLWCGDKLCHWEFDWGPGHLEQTGTWHPDDKGVAFVGPSRISQRTETAGSCVSFDFVSQFGAGVQMFLEVDIHDDGTVDHSLEIPASEWNKATYYITMPRSPFDEARFIIRKKGEPTAVFAQLRGKNASGCSGAAIVPKDPENGLPGAE